MAIKIACTNFYGISTINYGLIDVRQYTKRTPNDQHDPRCGVENEAQ